MPRKADLPLHSNKNRAWDGPAARRRMVDAAKDSDGNIKFEEAAQGFTYFTGDRSDPKQGDFKSPFADIISGTPAGDFIRRPDGLGHDLRTPSRHCPWRLAGAAVLACGLGAAALSVR